MTTRMPSIGTVLILVAFSLSAFGATLFVWKSFGGSTPLEAKGYRVQVRFPSGGTQLFPNADVRIAGVRVGKVRAVGPSGLRTLAELELEPRFAPLRSDARAILRTKTLLGETFVALTPGSRLAPALPEGGELPIGQVLDPQGVDRVLGTFDRRTRVAFREVLIGFAASLEGRGADINSAAGSLAPASEALRRLVSTLAARDTELRTLVRDSATLLRAVGARPAQLNRLIRTGETVVEATASRGRELTATVRALPGLLRETRATLTEAQFAADDAGPTLRVLRPVAPLVRPALVQGAHLAPVFARVSRRVGPLVTAARSGLPALTRLVDEAGPLLGTLRDAGRDLVPVLETIDAYKVDLVSALATVAALGQGNTEGRHYLRPLFMLWNETLVGYEEKLGSSRSNPYPRPMAMEKLFAGSLESLNCSTAGNAQLVPVIGSGAPPCREQGPWTLRGRTALLPAPLRDGP